MIKVFTVFETMSNGDRVLYNIYPSMLKAVSESEKRLQEDDEIMSMLMNTLHKSGCNEINDEWYRAMKATEAMTQIKCMIHVEW